MDHFAGLDVSVKETSVQQPTSSAKLVELLGGGASMTDFAAALPSCDKPVKLERVSSDTKYKNIDHRLFICERGRTSDQLVAEER